MDNFGLIHIGGQNENNNLGSRKIKRKILKLAIAEYTKRLGAYSKIEVVEVPDEKHPKQ